MKIRIVLLILGSFLISTDSFAISLKEQSIVSEDVIRLKDLFHGVKNNADRILGAAPRPGELIQSTPEHCSALLLLLIWNGAQHLLPITFKSLAQQQ